MNRSDPGRDTWLDGPITETEAPMPGGTDDDAGVSHSGSLSVLLASVRETVTFTATVSQNSHPPVTHTGGHFELVLDGHSSSHLSLYDLIV